MRSIVRDHRYRVLAGIIALVAGGVVFWLATDLFPYHSSNHDEGVYLQQAAMLLEGRLWLTPGSDALREAVHPWFFVESERGLYPKYTPVPAAMFAAGELLGGYRRSLFAVATVTVALVYAVTVAAFDRRTGVLAAAIVAAAPLFLLTSAVFLPYAPTTALNLLFALAYIRSVRRDDRRFAAIAGAAIGLSFFARPYTAVLFAAPFVVHALWRLGRAIPSHPGVIARTAVTAGVGLLFVGVTLGYNAVMTGSALLFPYEAFAPLDGLGFGRREILGHARVYTVEEALRANAAVLRALATDWFTAGALGTLASLFGAGAVIAGTRRDGLDRTAPLSNRQLQLVLLGVAASVIVGNVYFWGNRNILAALGDPTDGLISLFGPFYHFDLLLPMAAFAAHGVIAGFDRVRTRLHKHTGPRLARVAVTVAVVSAVAAVGAAEADALGPPIERNAAFTAKFERADAPLREAEFEHALVFFPPTYGEWRNHPFQWRRNDPGFDGPAVYVLARNPAADVAVLSAYPDRTVYRYRYHGEWTPVAANHVRPLLERLDRVEGRSVRARTTVTVPDRIRSASVTVATDAGRTTSDYSGDPPDRLVLNWTVTPDGVRVDHPDLVGPTGQSSGGVPYRDTDEIALAVTISEPGGGTLTYREEVLVRRTDGGVQVLWPPASSVCPLVTDCGLEGTYLPDEPDTRPTGIAMNTTLRGSSATGGERT